LPKDKLASFSSKLGLRRLVLYYIALAILLAVAIVLFGSGDSPEADAPRITILATWCSNGEQVVELQVNPPRYEIVGWQLVQANGVGEFHGYEKVSEATFTLHFVGLHGGDTSTARRSIPNSLGSYTMAYIPAETSNRIEAGLSCDRNGIQDYLQRLRDCWEQKTLSALGRKSHPRFVDVNTEIITNALPGVP